MTELSAATARSSLELSNLPRAVVPRIEFSSIKTEDIIQMRFVQFVQLLEVDK